jgi:transposase
MLTQEQAGEVRVLHCQGQSVRSIAKELGCSRNTVRRCLRDAGAARYGPRAPRRCKLDPCKPYVLERVHAARPHWIPATVLLREIVERGYAGGISQLKGRPEKLTVHSIAPLAKGAKWSLKTCRWCVWA